MAAQWYCVQNSVKTGPLTGRELKQLAASGQLSENDLIWKEGRAKPVKASEIQGLFVQPKSGTLTISRPPRLIGFYFPIGLLPLF